MSNLILFLLSTLLHHLLHCHVTCSFARLLKSVVGLDRITVNFVQLVIATTYQQGLRSSWPSVCSFMAAKKSIPRSGVHFFKIKSFHRTLRHFYLLPAASSLFIYFTERQYEQPWQQALFTTCTKQWSSYERTCNLVLSNLEHDSQHPEELQAAGHILARQSLAN